MTPVFRTPGVYIAEVPTPPTRILPLPSGVTAFVGRAGRGPTDRDGVAPPVITSLAMFESTFGAIDPALPMTRAVLDFFTNGGRRAVIVRIVPRGWAAMLSEADLLGDDVAGHGLHALQRAEPFDLACIPPDTPDGTVAPAVYAAALDLCVARRALLLVDPPAHWTYADVAWMAGRDPTHVAQTVCGIADARARNAMLVFPRLSDAPAPDGTPGARRVPCGAIAGLIARTDDTRGIWRAPAGVDASLVGAATLDVAMTSDEQAPLNRAGVNALRQFSRGDPPILWGARTLRGADAFADDYKYVPVRRLALHIASTLEQGLAWTVFEPNDAALWARIRMLADAFLSGLFTDGAFQGSTAQHAYFVRCDAETTTADDLAAGRVHLQVGFAPLKPAEFLVLRIALQAAPRVADAAS